MLRRAGLLITVACIALLSSPFAHADEKMSLDGTVKLTTTSVNIVVGYRWGEGTLTYKGKDYPFEIDGLTVGAVGASKAEVSGDVFNLKTLEDFNGVYKGVGVNATVVGGAGGSELKNEKGVVLRMSRTSVGLQLQAGGDGVKLKLK